MAQRTDRNNNFIVNAPDWVPLDNNNRPEIIPWMLDETIHQAPSPPTDDREPVMPIAAPIPMDMMRM